jgi:phosphate-selective porin OprO/OprP
MNQRSTLLFLCISFLALPATAQVVDPQNVLVKNVFIVGRADEGESTPVNILIRDGRLEIVTKDEVALADGTVPIDGNGGFVVGALVIGNAPSFVIYDEDPEVNFEVLVDSGPHVTFAVNNGELLRNTLFEVQESAAEAARDDVTTAGWIAYTPPPMAIPGSYFDDTKWNKWESKYVDGIFLAAAVLDRVHWSHQNSDSGEQVGDLSDGEWGEVRGFRVGAVGTINFSKPWVYTVFGATNAFDKGFEIERKDSFTLFDYRLDIPVFDNMFLSVGKQKEPISMERIMSMVQLPMQERSSAADAFLPSRNLGVVLSGTAMNRKMTWAGGIFNNFIDSDESIGDTATQLIGRATWLPFVSDDESNIVHLGAGFRQSNAKQGVNYLTEPEINKSPIFVDTELINASDSMQLNLEATWRKGPYWLAAEYVSTDVDTPTQGNLSFDGYHITGSWIVSGEMRSYNRTSGILGPAPIAKSVYQGGWGAWEVSARYSTIDLTDGLIDGGEMDIWSVGLNWWLSPIFNVNMNYRFIDNERDGFSGESSGFVTRVMVVLE